MDDFEKVILGLSRSHYRRSKSKHSPLPSISSFHTDGLVVQLLSQGGIERIQKQQGNLDNYPDEEIVPVEGLWGFFPRVRFLWLLRSHV